MAFYARVFRISRTTITTTTTTTTTTNNNNNNNNNNNTEFYIAKRICKHISLKAYNELY